MSILSESSDGITPGSTRRSAATAGVFYLITFISSIPAVFLLAPVLNDPGYIVGAGADTRVLWGAALDMVNAFACIGTAVALFSVVKRQQEGLSLGFVTTRLMEAAIILIGVVALLAVVAVRQDGAAGSESVALIAVGRALVSARDWTFLLGPGLMPAFNAMLLGTLMYRSDLVPRAIPIMGLIGAPLLLSSTIGTMFGINETISLWSTVGTIPIFFWELSLGLWMTFKGFKPSSPLFTTDPKVSTQSGAPIMDAA